MVLSQLNKHKRMIGIWDSRISPVNLGGLLTLVEELQIQCVIHGRDSVDIGIVCGEVNENLVTLTSALKNIEGVDNCYTVNTIEGLQKFIDSHSCVSWPVISEKGLADYEYGSTLSIQQFYRKTGYVPYLSCKSDSLNWARDFIERHCLPRMPVVAHLKNNPKLKNCSNADFAAWLDFLSNCHKKYNAVFVLIGNEDVPEQIRKLPNVVISKDFDSNLSRDLALIQLSFMFMGMASGPCNMAVFSATPYIIYKDPDHHAEEMKKELGDNDHFSFAAPLQKILRVFQAGSNLISEFDYFYGRIKLKDWEARFASPDKAIKRNKIRERNPI